MTETPVPSEAAVTAAEACAQCGRTLVSGDRVETGGRVFCRSCYTSLRAELEQVVGAMSSDINYANATVGALLGGAVGALAWWGFTVLTHWSVGLIAIAIGWLAGFGAVKFAGEKRSAALQWIAVGAAALSYLVASYLVNMTFANKTLAERGEGFRVPFPPTSPEMFFNVVALGFGMMDVVFLAIALWEAWKQPKPLALPPESAA